MLRGLGRLKLRGLVGDLLSFASGSVALAFENAGLVHYTGGRVVPIVGLVLELAASTQVSPYGATDSISAANMHGGIVGGEQQLLRLLAVGVGCWFGRVSRGGLGLIVG